MPTENHPAPLGPQPKPVNDPVPVVSPGIMNLGPSAKKFVLFALLLALCFGKPLYDLLRYALHSDLYSHVVLIPFVSVYLIWLKKRDLPLAFKPARGAAFLPFALGLAGLAAYLLSVRSGWKPTRDDYLALTIFSFFCFLVGGGLLFFGRDALRRVLFPVGFLIFIVPFPTVILNGIETLLQYGSADVAEAFLTIAGMPLLRNGTEFRLPGFSMQVAPECSGIRSTLVLFITSTVAGYLFLRSPWRRGVLALAVIPLALLRNGFRIFTISELCVNVSPDMIDSYIHRKGGPIFFVLSLIPFFLFLLWLRKSELKKKPPGAVPSQVR